MAFLWRHLLIEQQEERIKHRRPNVDPLCKWTAIELTCFQLIFWLNLISDSRKVLKALMVKVIS
jgi:hypothetical protein